MVECSVGADVDEAVMMQLLEDISLVPTSKEKATFIMDYDEAQISDVDDQSVVIVEEASLFLLNLRLP